MGTLSVLEVIRELYMSLTAPLFNLLFLGVLQTQGYQHLPSKRAFRNLTLMVAVANAASCVDVLFFMSDLRVSPVLTVSTSVVVTMTNHLMAFFFSIYFVRFFGALEQKDAGIPVAGHLVVLVKTLVMAVWLAWAVSHTLRTGERVDFSPLMSMVFGYGFNMYHLVYCLFYFLRKRRILRRRIRHAVIVGFVVVMSTIILQTIIGIVPHVYYLGATISLLIFYFYLESRPAAEIVLPQYQERNARKSEELSPYVSQTEEGTAKPQRDADTKPRQRIRKRSVVRRTFAVTSCLIIGSYILLAALLYRRAQDMFMSELKTRSLGIAKTCAEMIDGAAFSRLLPGDEDTADYRTVMDALVLFRDHSGLQFIYTVTYNEEHIPVIWVDSDPDAPSSIGGTLNDFREAYIALDGTPAAADEPTSDIWGTHLSAYAPFYHEGRVAGAVGVDIDYTWIQTRLRQLLTLIGGICSILLAVTMITLWFISSYMKRKFALLDEKIEDLSFDTYRMTKLEGLRDGDEFERIAEHINEVFEKNMAAQKTEADKLRSAMEEVEKKADEKMAEADRMMRRAQTAPRIAPSAGAFPDAEPVTEVPVADTKPHPAPAPAPAALLPPPDDTLSKEEAIRLVREATKTLLSSYRELGGVIGPYLVPEGSGEQQEDLPEIDPEELAEFYEAVLEFSERYDLDAIEKLLDQVKGYAIPQAEKERFEKVKLAASSSDWDSLRGILS